MIRIATQDDLPLIKEIYHEVFYNPDSEELYARVLRQLNESFSESCLFVAVEKGQPVGYIAAHSLAFSREIFDLVFAPVSYSINPGIQHELLEFYEGIAREKYPGYKAGVQFYDNTFGKNSYILCIRDGYVSSIGVTESMKRKGIAKKLLSFAEEVFLSRRGRAMFVYCQEGAFSEPLFISQGYSPVVRMGPTAPLAPGQGYTTLFMGKMLK